MLIPDNWGELLLPGLRRIFDKHTQQLPDYLSELFTVETSERAQEFSLGVGSLGIMDEWTASGKRISYEDLEKGFKVVYTPKKYSKGIMIERELLEDDLYGEIKKRARKLSDMVYYTRQKHAASVFNRAFDAGVVGADGKPLCSTVHPVMPGSAKTQSNAGSYELNAANVELVRTKMLEWTDDKNNEIYIMPDTLIVPPALRKAAIVIADSDREPDTTDNNINVWKGSLNVIEYRFLTDPTAWFLVDSRRMKEYLKWYDRRKPKLEMDEEFDTEVAKYKTVGRWSFGWDDWSWIFGCKP